MDYNSLKKSVQRRLDQRLSNNLSNHQLNENATGNAAVDGKNVDYNKVNLINKLCSVDISKRAESIRSLA